jgi:hypothetical protein
VAAVLWSATTPGSSADESDVLLELLDLSVWAIGAAVDPAGVAADACPLNRPQARTAARNAATISCNLREVLAECCTAPTVPVGW